MRGQRGSFVKGPSSHRSAVPPWPIADFSRQAHGAESMQDWLCRTFGCSCPGFLRCGTSSSRRSLELPLAVGSLPRCPSLLGSVSLHRWTPLLPAFVPCACSRCSGSFAGSRRAMLQPVVPDVNVNSMPVVFVSLPLLAGPQSVGLFCATSPRLSPRDACSRVALSSGPSPVWKALSQRLWAWGPFLF